MSPIAFLFLAVTGMSVLMVPRRWAPFPLLVGACYMTLGQGIEVWGFNFYIIRLLLLAGFARVLLRRERPRGGMQGMDWAFLAWAGWAIVASAFHSEPIVTLERHLGMAYNGLGIYFLMRCFCSTEEEVRGVVRMTAWILLPIALAMLYEHTSRYNIFSILGGINEEPIIRQGRLRAQGPFATSILAGTVGGACLPLMVGICRFHPRSAFVGLAACLTIALASSSSGPIVTTIAGFCALALWRWRHLTRLMRIAAVITYLLLELVMKAPAYFLIARIDLAGGSKGWHRAAIIDAAVTHFKEWWFAGTDYTRHWMAYGVSWSGDHADITNHYLGQGVKGGALLMLLFISLLWIGFRYVGQALRLSSDAPAKRQFLVWSLGASLFAHTVTCISIAYFDQSILFLYLTLALIASVRANATTDVAAREQGECNAHAQGKGAREALLQSV